MQAVAALAAAVLAAVAPAGAWELENPAPGVYVHYGRQALADADNRGDIANLAFVVGDRCVAVIDTGGSLAVGMALREAIRRVTERPVCYVINTHVHPDHILGNAAFVPDRPQFVGHARLPQALARRGGHYLNALQRDLGPAAAGTVLVPPSLTVETTARLDLGGRVLLLRAWPPAHTDHDLTVFDEQTATLFLGDLVFVGHLPVIDGSLRGMLAALQELQRTPAQIAIAGHGRIERWPAAIEPQLQYLERLRTEVTASLRAGRTLAQTLEDAGQWSGGGWLLADVFHRRNVAAAFAELEWDE
ncbi:MAG: quinoprotein relay system zinc metallohydrolase 2 [Burkholderiaceae bacterium]|nr:quinoprotein relay system zinc metallohydrolase 2 [Burkholderiaceae bacterium]